ncbi:uncharacterized protein LOC103702047 [Phoenix dactylifera]|uniref:Uncharacterized protein LOC103702047 n=1 Tax=Phoenix dactylifera TaxID=42345 RepID=A0A8B9AME9_PHODC|nr:uncharacterized protein LOC103702047 [Phoenix dactylifera]XP_038985197.1 uncharacterized protein LOC103702047 [Phoenix dactylifera]XP_038985198.1 uncharacterized protein LOC103702047 [Phoenix dactylifera]
MGLSRRWRSRYLFFVPLILFLPLILSVSRLNRNSIPDQEPTRRLSKKSDHLVLGPAAGQGLPNRLQCHGLKAVNKIHSTSKGQNLQSSDVVSFVTVYAVYNSSLKLDSTHTDVVNVGNISYSKAERSVAILNTFINFIQVSMPRSSVIILTDPASEFSLERNNAAVVPIQGDYSRGKLMLQRIRSYIAFLETRLAEHLERLNSSNHYVFTDSDIAVVDDIGHIFQRYPQFHLALTFRNNKDQPLNSGFIAVRGTPDGIYKAKAFLQEVLDVYSSKYMKASRMLGDQLALAWVVRSHLPFSAKKFARHEAFSGEINGASVLFLPCAVYNWTPPEGAGQFHGMPLDVQIVHFKGSRKRLMLESWNFFNSTSIMADMLCLILKSGRTKYDF